MHHLIEKLSFPTLRVLAWTGAALLLSSSPVRADPEVEFDFPRSVECRDVTPCEYVTSYPNERVVEAVFPISIRFRGDDPQKVEQVSVEIDASSAGLLAESFSPQTNVLSEHARNVKETTTTEKARSIDATLGGEMPVPYGDFVAHVAPSVSAAQSRREISTKTTTRLPPLEAVVVSGTRKQGQGVFFELKRSTQTPLEGVHELTVSFVVPAEWESSTVNVALQARGHRKVLWMDQEQVWGAAGGPVELYLAGSRDARLVTKPGPEPVKRCQFLLFSRPKPAQERAEE